MPVTINGTTGIVNPDGTAAAPSLVGSDNNTGVFFPAADTVAVAAGGVEALRVDPSRNLMVGTATNTNGSKIVSNGVIESTTGGVRFPDGTTQTTAAAASSYVGARAQIFSTAGSFTFTVPTGVTAVAVTVIGGGAGGVRLTVCGGFNYTRGCAGATALRWITGLTPGGTVSVTVGGGGNGISTGNNTSSSGAGGTSSFGAFCSASGGGATSPAGGNSNPTATASGGDFNRNGFSSQFANNFVAFNGNPGTDAAGAVGIGGMGNASGGAGLVLVEW